MEASVSCPKTPAKKREPDLSTGMDKKSFVIAYGDSLVFRFKNCLVTLKNKSGKQVSDELLNQVEKAFLEKKSIKGCSTYLNDFEISSIKGRGADNTTLCKIDSFVDGVPVAKNLVIEDVKIAKPFRFAGDELTFKNVVFMPSSFVVTDHAKIITCQNSTFPQNELGGLKELKNLIETFGHDENFSSAFKALAPLSSQNKQTYQQALKKIYSVLIKEVKDEDLIKAIKRAFKVRTSEISSAMKIDYRKELDRDGRFSSPDKARLKAIHDIIAAEFNAIKRKNMFKFVGRAEQLTFDSSFGTFDQSFLKLRGSDGKRSQIKFLRNGEDIPTDELLELYAGSIIKDKNAKEFCQAFYKKRYQRELDEITSRTKPSSQLTRYEGKYLGADGKKEKKQNILKTIRKRNALGVIGIVLPSFCVKSAFEFFKIHQKLDSWFNKPFKGMVTYFRRKKMAKIAQDIKDATNELTRLKEKLIKLKNWALSYSARLKGEKTFLPCKDVNTGLVANGAKQVSYVFNGTSIKVIKRTELAKGVKESYRFRFACRILKKYHKSIKDVVLPVFRQTAGALKCLNMQDPHSFKKCLRYLGSSATYLLGRVHESQKK